MRLPTAGLFGALMFMVGPAFAASVQFANLLPPNTTASQVKTDATGNIYVGGDYYSNQGAGFLAKISADESRLIYFSPGPGLGDGLLQSFHFGTFAVEPDGSVYASSTLLSHSLMGFVSAATIYKINPTGGAWASVRGYAAVNDLTADAEGNIYLTGIGDGYATSTPGSPSGTNGSNDFIQKLDPTLKTVIFAIEHFGGSHIAVRSDGAIYAVGADTFGITPTPGAYQSGTGPGHCQYAPKTLTGLGCTNQYVIGIDPTGTQILFATYLSSGSGGESPSGIVVDSAGIVYIAGSTQSSQYPVTDGALQPEFSAQEPNANGELTSGYVSALNPTGTGLVFSTFFGGSNYDTVASISFDEKDQLVYIAGLANSADLPGLFGIYQNCVPQSYVARITMDGAAVTRTATISPNYFPPAITINAAGYAVFADEGQVAQVNFDSMDAPVACLADSAGVFVTNSVAPGQLLTIFGNELATATSSTQPANGVYPTSGQSAAVTFNGLPAPLLYESPHQINVQVPFEVAGQTSVTIQVSNAGQAGSQVVDSLVVPVVTANPSLFEVPAISTECTDAYPGQLVTLALNQDGTRNGCGNPAKAGSTITVFLDGIGITSTAQTTGSIVVTPSALGATLTFETYSLTANSIETVPGAISGVYAVQIQIPGPGPYLYGSLYGALYPTYMNVAGNLSVQVVP